MVEACKMPLTEAIFDEPVLPALVMQAQVAGGPGNGKSPLTTPAFQELHGTRLVVIEF
jgi:hypothetical protein